MKKPAQNGSAAEVLRPAKATGVARAERPAVKRTRASTGEDFKSAVLTIRVKEQLKDEATRTLAEIGISLPEAVRVFLNRVVSEGGFPFRLEVPNATTRAAMEEGRHLRGRFATAKDMFDDLEKGGAQ